MKILNKIIIGVVVNGLALYLVTKFLFDVHYSGELLFLLLVGLLLVF